VQLGDASWQVRTRNRAPPRCGAKSVERDCCLRLRAREGLIVLFKQPPLVLRLFHLMITVVRVTTSTEIRPGTVRERELALVERALARTGGSVERGAQLVDAAGSPVDLPDEIADALMAIVHQLQAGNGVSVVPMHAELTTVEAAEMLNVSRPHLIKQLHLGALPFRMVGTHRRVRLVDLLAYRDAQDASSREALDELTRQAEDLGLYD